MSAFQPCAAMPANTSSYKELGEQDYRRYTMSYAVIVTGGKQYKVAPGEYLKIEKLEIATGESVTFDRVISQGRHDKIRIIKFRRRKHHMKRMGHRQWYTEIKITGIQA
jgi:large subunit ribosomal protein L21